jgi:hypothetical protein
MNIRNWLAREHTYLNYLREDYIDWSAVPQYEINSLIYWVHHSDVQRERMRSLNLSPIEYVKYLGDIEIDIARKGLQEYGKQYAIGAIADSKLPEDNHEAI